ncbi:MAG: YhgE/Pip domain-containing protein [Clostridium sp.]
MRGAFKVYFKDIKNISKNIIAIIIVLGLSVLPSLYAWFNIASSWDPYGNLEDISVAIVNLDRGTTVFDKEINIGEMATDNLKESRALDFQFVDSKKAENGLRNGKYYATITITEEFSKDIVSVLDPIQKKPKLIYRVNEKKNAVAPKITGKSADLLQDEIGKSFIKNITKTIFEASNKLGIKLDDKMPLISKFENLIFDIEDKTSDIKNGVNKLYDTGVKAEDKVKSIQNEIPNINNHINDAIELSKSMTSFINDLVINIEDAYPYVVQLLKEVHKSSQEVNSYIEPGDAQLKGDKAIEKIKLIKESENLLLGKVNVMIGIVENLGMEKIPSLVTLHSKLLDLRKNIQSSIDILDGLEKKVVAGGDIAMNVTLQLKEVLGAISWKANNILGDMETKYEDGFYEATDNLKKILNTSTNILSTTSKEIPRIQGILNNTSVALNKGVDLLGYAKENMDEAGDAIKKVADKIRELKDDKDFQKALDLIKADAIKESDFFSDPVELVENRLYSLPNYGSAMSPFFTTLCLWVGGLLLVNVFTTKVYCEEGEFTSKDKYLGRCMTFLTIGVFQAIIVTLGDIYILGTYVSSQMWFVLAAVFISIVFTAIIYTACFVVGNLGKAISIILLVLQLSSSGGTFPIEATPSFFRLIHPYMPFTYAIGLIKETVSGIYPETVQRCLIVLVFYLVITIGFGLYISTKKGDLGDRVIAKMRDSGIVEK